SSASAFVRTPVLCAYRPVRMPAREGQHRGVVVNPFVNVVPPLANRRRVAGMTPRVPMRWSSVRMTRMLGRVPECGAGMDKVHETRANVHKHTSVRLAERGGGTTSPQGRERAGG